MAFLVPSTVVDDSTSSHTTTISLRNDVLLLPTINTPHPRSPLLLAQVNPKLKKHPTHPHISHANKHLLRREVQPAPGPSHSYYYAKSKGAITSPLNFLHSVV
jgi:hypothetical protein